MCFGLGVYLHSAQRGYQGAAHLVGLIAQRLGYGSLWQQQVYPQFNALISWGFQHWTIALLGFLLLVYCPVVTAVYAVVNALVLLMGYNVRPFIVWRLGRFQKMFRARAMRKMGDNDGSASADADVD